MNAITINIDPTMLRLGPLVLSWHGFFSALGLLVGLWLASRVVKPWGVSEEAFSSTAFWGVIGGIIGARLVHVVDQWHLYADDPIRILFITEGGIALFGAILGGTIAGALYAWRAGLPIGRLAVAAAFGLLIGQAIGRIGDLINGEHWAKPTDLPWAVVYVHPNTLGQRGIPVHPVVGIYEPLYDLAVFALLWPFRYRMPRAGMVFWAYLGLYSLGRFFLSVLRLDRVWFWGLQEAQLIAIPTMLVSAFFFVRLWRSATTAQPTARARGRRVR